MAMKDPLILGPNKALAALLLAIATDAPPWRVAAAVVIAVSLAVVAVCLRRAG